MIEAGQKYDAVVVGAKATESKSGKPAIWVNFQVLDGSGNAIGNLPKMIWLTPGNRERARKDLKELGASELHVTTKAGFHEFLSSPATFLSGAECSVVTEETEYEGTKRVEVKWINPRLKPASASALLQAESLFADAPSQDDWDAPPPSDGDVPY